MREKGFRRLLGSAYDPCRRPRPAPQSQSPTMKALLLTSLLAVPAAVLLGAACLPDTGPASQASTGALQAVSGGTAAEASGQRLQGKEVQLLYRVQVDRIDLPIQWYSVLEFAAGTPVADPSGTIYYPNGDIVEGDRWTLTEADLLQAFQAFTPAPAGSTAVVPARDMLILVQDEATELAGFLNAAEYLGAPGTLHGMLTTVKSQWPEGDPRSLPESGSPPPEMDFAVTVRSSLRDPGFSLASIGPGYGRVTHDGQGTFAFAGKLGEGPQAGQSGWLHLGRGDGRYWLWFTAD